MSHSPVLDRIRRDRLVEVLLDFLDGKLSDDTYEDKMLEIVSGCQDKTVTYVADCLWHFYEYEVAEFSKSELDLHFRLLLILRSDAHIKVVNRWDWGGPQVHALYLTLLFFGLLLYFGVVPQLLLASIPLTIASCLLYRWHRWRRPPVTAWEQAIHPFASVGEILRVRRSVQDYRKPRHTLAETPLPQNSWLVSQLLNAVGWLFRLITSPLDLILLALPRCDASTSVRLL